MTTTPVAAPRELVLASAGAGKTFRISSRLIGLLNAGATPEQIFASSFTRKAAGQILDRTLARLARAALDPAEAGELAVHATLGGAHPAPADREHWGALLERTIAALHRLNVGTLDAFMVGAAASFEAELGLPPGWRIADQPAQAALVSRALSRVLASADRPRLRQLARASARGAAVRSVHERLAKVMGELLAISEKLDPAADDPWGRFRSGGRCAVASPARRAEMADALASAPLPRSANGRENPTWRSAIDKIVDCLRVGDWEGVADQTLCRRVALGDTTFSNAEIAGPIADLLEQLVGMTRQALRSILADQIEALGALTAIYHDEYRSLQHQAGLFSFGDITRLVGSGDPLGDRADLYYRLDGQIRHILLDEFQDTSLQQWEALHPLVDEVLSDAGRAAIIVADPKQSIYAWRGAEPALVHQVGDRYTLADEHLAVSWRSSPVVLDFVNQVFGGITANPVLVNDPVRARVAASWAYDFRPHRAQKAHLPGHIAIEAGPEDDTGGTRRPLLSRFAAARIAELAAAAPGFNIGVLTRTNEAVARLFLELKELGVPVSQEGGTPLTDSAACEAVIALLRLADHPADRVAAFQVAQSPLGEAVQLIDHDDHDAVHRAARRIRRRLVEDGYGGTVTALARRIAPHCDRREGRRLSQLAELAHQYDTQATLRPADFVRFVESTRVEDPTTADVRVMTVHQAKGLEFDIVVLPELGSGMEKQGRAPVLAYRDQPAGRITAILPAVRETLRAYFPELEEAHAQMRESLWRDELSGLYVALTRARYAVHAIVAPSTMKATERTVTPAALIWAAVDGGPPPLGAPPGTTLHRSGSPDWHHDPDAEPHGSSARAPVAEPVPVRLRPDSAGRAVRRQSPSQLHGEQLDVRELLRVDTADAMERGSLIHAWCERIGWIEDGFPDDDDLLAVGRRAAPNLPASLLEESLREFRLWMDHAPVRSALSRSRYPTADTLLERELPFVELRNGVYMEGIIDRLVLTREGGRVVAAEVMDFKTDRLKPAEVPRRLAFYRPQLEAYAAAVSSMYRIPRDHCAATVVFLEAGRVESVRTEPPQIDLPLLPTP